MSDGSLVGIDRRSAEVRVYDETGLYLRSMGGMGEGPGEFSDAFHLWILPGDTLWVGDYRPWRYNVFSPVGDFLRSVPTPSWWRCTTPAAGWPAPSHGFRMRSGVT